MERALDRTRQLRTTARYRDAYLLKRYSFLLCDVLHTTPSPLSYVHQRVFLDHLFVCVSYCIGDGRHLRNWRSHKMDSAAALHRKARWFLPLLFLVINAIIVLGFFG